MTEAISLGEGVCSLYAALQDRLEKAADNPQLASDLGHHFELLHTNLSNLSKVCSDNNMQVSNNLIAIYRTKIHSFNTDIRAILAQVEAMNTKLRRRRFRLRKVHAVNDWLSEQYKVAAEIDARVLEIANCFTHVEANSKSNSDQANIIGSAIGNALVAGIDKLALNQGASRNHASEDEDEFQPTFDVPENPPYVILKYGSVSDAQDAPQTAEAELKKAVLRIGTTRNVGAVGMRGMSGVGKSCALRGLAGDLDVKNWFDGGVYWLSLGQDATERDLIRQLEHIVTNSGGRKAGQALAQEGRIKEVVSRTTRWFSGKRILLLIDDVWADNDIGCDIIGRLRPIADLGCGSRVAFTTRDLMLIRQSTAVVFAMRGKTESIEMLLAAAELEERDFQDSREAIEEVLDRCGGLPLALSVAGSAIAMHQMVCTELGLEAACQEYLQEIEQIPGTIVDERVDHFGSANLSSAFRASLAMLDRKVTSMDEWPLSYALMYQSLVVIERQGWIPISVLRLLWGLTEVRAKKVLRIFSMASLAERKERLLNGKRTAGITLHDLQLDFVQAECARTKNGEGGKEWHRRILRGWMHGRREDENVDILLHEFWTKDEVINEEYVQNNLNRHLRDAGLIYEWRMLMQDPRWAAKRLANLESLGFEEDCRMLIEYLREEEGVSPGRGNEAWSLKMIARAARLSAPYLLQGKNELWFQLYARLIDVGKQSEFVRQYMSAIERVSDKPWLKPLTSCLNGPDALIEQILCDEAMMGMCACRKHGRTLVWGTCEKGAYVSTFVRGSLEEEAVLNMEKSAKRFSQNVTSEKTDGVVKDGRHLMGSDEEYDDTSSSSNSGLADISAMSCTRDGEYAVTGHVDGRMQLWNAKTGEIVGEPLCGHSNYVQYLAWSGDCSTLLSSAGDGTLQVWDMSVRKVLGDAVRPQRDCVRCCAWSPDGTRVVCGGTFSGFRLWDGTKRDLTWEALDDEAGPYSCVVWSSDDPNVVNGIVNGVVRTFHVTKKTVIDARPHGCVSGSRRMLLSGNGKKLLCGGWDGTVRIWDVMQKEFTWEAQDAHTDPINFLEWLPAQKRLVSAGSDGRIRIWDTGEGEQETCELNKKSRRAGVAEWSPDGTKLLTGGWDGILRMWDGQNGTVVWEMNSHIRMIDGVVWSCDGENVLSWAGDGTVIVTCSKDGQAMVLDIVEEMVGCASWSPDSTKLIIGTGNGSMALWDSGKRKLLWEVLAHDSRVQCLAWSADGKRVACGAWNGNVQILRVRDGKQLANTSHTCDEPCSCLSWSPNGKTLALGAADGRIWTWDTELDTTVGDTLDGHYEIARHVSWSADGKRIASSGLDRRVRIWDTEKGDVRWRENSSETVDNFELGLILGAGDTAFYEKGQQGDCLKVRLEGTYVVYSSGSEEMHLATFEDVTSWSYSPSSRHFSIFFGGRIEFLELIE